MNKPKAGENWQHANGTVYTVMGLGNEKSDDRETVVVYRTEVRGAPMYTKPLSTWHERMVEVGRQRPWLVEGTLKVDLRIRTTSPAKGLAIAKGIDEMMIRADKLNFPGFLPPNHWEICDVTATCVFPGGAVDEKLKGLE